MLALHCPYMCVLHLTMMTMQWWCAPIVHRIPEAAIRHPSTLILLLLNITHLPFLPAFSVTEKYLEVNATTLPPGLVSRYIKKCERAGRQSKNGATLSKYLKRTWQLSSSSRFYSHCAFKAWLGSEKTGSVRLCDWLTLYHRCVFDDSHAQNLIKHWRNEKYVDFYSFSNIL